MYPRIKDLRIEKGIGIAALAKKIGIPATKYWRYESGEREVAIHVLIKLVQFYNVRADYLLELSDRR